MARSAQFAAPGSSDGEVSPSAEALLRRVARGDEQAFEQLYDELSGQVLGLVERVVRDRAQSEEVAQEVLIEVWRTAARFDAERGSARTWVLTIAHRRAVDRVRSAVAGGQREARVATLEREVDIVSETVTTRLEHEQVRRCLDGLTELQREAVTLAYYNGHTYREVAALVDAPEGTVKTRIRDGLIRLRDCLGVQR